MSGVAVNGSRIIYLEIYMASIQKKLEFNNFIGILSDSMKNHRANSPCTYASTDSPSTVIS